MGKSLYSSGWVVINGNQTTTLNGAKIFNTGIPLIAPVIVEPIV
jgi:hypothetical protein